MPKQPSFKIPVIGALISGVLLLFLFFFLPTIDQYPAEVSNQDAAVVNANPPLESESTNTNTVVEYEIEYDPSTNPRIDVDLSNIPSDIDPGQLYASYRVGTDVYLIAYQKGPMGYLEGLARIKSDGKMYFDEVDWMGALVSSDEGKTWKKFFTIQNSIDESSAPEYGPYELEWNVAGVYERNRRLYVDLYVINGGGSGDGTMARFYTTNNGTTFFYEGCYDYSVERYYNPPDTDIRELTPEKITIRLDDIRCGYERGYQQ